MARKDRVPNPPKRSQGPQKRTGQASPAAAAKRRQGLLLFGGGALALAVAVLAVVLLTGAGDTNERQAMADAGCTLQSFPAVSNKPDHTDVPTLATKPKWNSSPPTSGPHWNTPAIWDFYDTPVLLVQTVHNLEHGGVVIHYGPRVPQAEIDKLREFYNEDPNGLVVAPLPSNGDKITLSAWTVPDSVAGTADRGRGWLARCSRFDKDAFSAFLEAHRFKGPERLDPAGLTPGN
jgi:hypothetical protein